MRAAIHKRNETLDRTKPDVMNEDAFARRTLLRLKARRHEKAEDVRLMTDAELAAAFYGIAHRPGMEIRQPSDDELRDLIEITQR